MTHENLLFSKTLFGKALLKIFAVSIILSLFMFLFMSFVQAQDTSSSNSQLSQLDIPGMVGIVSEVRGNVFRTPSESEARIRLHEGDPILIADLIVTGDDAFIKINSDDEMLFVLTGNSVLLVQDVLYDDVNDGTVLYSIIKGGFMMIAGPKAQRHRGVQMQTTAGNIGLDGTIIAGNIFSNGTAFNIGLIEGAISFTPSNTDNQVNMSSALTMIGGDALSDDMANLAPVSMDLDNMVSLYQDQFSVLSAAELELLVSMLKTALEEEGRNSDIDGAIQNSISQNNEAIGTGPQTNNEDAGKNTNESPLSTSSNLQQNPKQLALEDMITQKALDNANQSTVDNEDDGLLGSGAPPPLPPIFSPPPPPEGVGVISGVGFDLKGEYNDLWMMQTFESAPPHSSSPIQVTKTKIGGDVVFEYGKFTMNTPLAFFNSPQIELFEKGWYVAGSLQTQTPWLTEQIGGSASYNGIIMGDFIKDGTVHYDHIGGTFAMNLNFATNTLIMDFRPEMTQGIGPTNDDVYDIENTHITDATPQSASYQLELNESIRSITIEGNYYGDNAQHTGGTFQQQQGDIKVVGIFASQ